MLSKKKELFEHLENIGIVKNDIILVHSSYKSLGQNSISAHLFLTYFMEYLESGTLLFPSLSHKFVTRANPYFNVTKTKSCVGYLSELFRTEFSSHRSMHPTHSVSALGKEAKSLTEFHKADNTPCGAKSPFSLLPDYEGKILMLGCGLKPNTSMHAIEEVIEPPYLFGNKTNYTLVDEKRETWEKLYVTHGFEGYAQRYDRIINSNLDNWIKHDKIFEADSFLLPAKRLWSEAKKLYKENPYYFVENI